MKRFIHNNKGIVMLEAVIAMPLYLLLFLAPIWLGQLAIDRTRLTQADRSYAMLKGTVSLDNLKTMLYRETQAFSIADASPTDSTSTDWWKKSQSRLTLTQELPSFLGGLVYLGTYVFNTPGSTLTGNQTMATQGNPSETTATSVAYVKNTGASVNRATLLSLADSTSVSSIQNMVSMPYVASSGDTSPSLTSMSSYTRDTNLKTWSE